MTTHSQKAFADVCDRITILSKRIACLEYEARASKLRLELGVMDRSGQTGLHDSVVDTARWFEEWRNEVEADFELYLMGRPSTPEAHHMVNENGENCPF
jgi:hypothetical protein